ncbi:Uncharacterised protein [uncultured archaeon]|nr:Uncharacterised protein [uncultured archaeon]
MSTLKSSRCFMGLLSCLSSFDIPSSFSSISFNSLFLVSISFLKYWVKSWTEAHLTPFRIGHRPSVPASFILLRVCFSNELTAACSWLSSCCCISSTVCCSISGARASILFSSCSISDESASAHFSFSTAPLNSKPSLLSDSRKAERAFISSSRALCFSTAGISWLFLDARPEISFRSFSARASFSFNTEMSDNSSRSGISRFSFRSFILTSSSACLFLKGKRRDNFTFCSSISRPISFIRSSSFLRFVRRETISFIGSLSSF